MKRVIYVTGVMSERTYLNTELPYWEGDPRIEFEIWGLEGATPIISDDAHKGDHFSVVPREELSGRICANREAFFVVAYDDERILEQFENSECEYITFAGTMIQPSTLYYRENYSRPRLFFNKLKAFSKRNMQENVRLIEKRVKEKNKEAKEINHPKAIVVPTKYAADTLLSLSQKKEKIICVHRFDYDRFLRINRNNDEPKEDYIVFADSCMADNHPDWVRLGYVSNVRKNRNKYYDQMEKLFKDLEEHYNLPVLIAGHPAGEYDEVSFRGREIIVGNTCELIRNAKAVIFHMSSSINYAVLYDKEILYVYNDDFTDMIYGIADQGSGYIKYVSEDLLGVNAINLSDKNSSEKPWSAFKKANRKLREEYIKKYIIDSQVKDNTTSEYLIDYIMEEKWKI